MFKISCPLYADNAIVYAGDDLLCWVCWLCVYKYLTKQKRFVASRK